MDRGTWAASTHRTDVAAIHEDLEQRRTPTESGPAEAHWPAAGRRLDRRFRIADLGGQLVRRVAMEPRLVLERVVADFVSRRNDGAQLIVVGGNGRIAAHDEERDPHVERVERAQRRVEEHVVVRRARLPPGVAVRLHVRPLIVDVERHARERAGICHDGGCGSGHEGAPAGPRTGALPARHGRCRRHTVAVLAPAGRSRDGRRTDQRSERRGLAGRQRERFVDVERPVRDLRGVHDEHVVNRRLERRQQGSRVVERGDGVDLAHARDA